MQNCNQVDTKIVEDLSKEAIPLRLQEGLSQLLTILFPNDLLPSRGCVHPALAAASECRSRLEVAVR